MTAPAENGTPRRAVLGQLPKMTRSDGSPIHILLVDDERALTNLLIMALRYEGWIVDTAHDAADAIDRFRETEPDLLVLDLMLPDSNGFEVLRVIRESPSYTPVLFLTARDSVVDRVAGLNAGGDDYMTKPFSLEELVARLRSLLRRSVAQTPDTDEVLRCGDLRLNGISHEVTRANTSISLSPTEFELLRYLMRNPRRALPRQEILEQVWNYDFRGRSNLVDLYVSYLRRKIDTGREPMIHTVRGLGYILRPSE